MSILIHPVTLAQKPYIGIHMTDFHHELYLKIKSIRFAFWSPLTKCWLIPYTAESWKECKNCLGSIEMRIQTEKLTMSPQRQKVENHTLEPELEKVYHAYYTRLYVKRYTSNTIKSYSHIFKSFLKDCIDKHPDEWTKEDMVDWIKHNLQTYHWSEAYQNSVINALKFYYEQVKGESRSFWEVRPRTPKKLPGTLSRQEIQLLFSSCQNLKHKLILMMIYSCGLRISEMVHLRKRDVDILQSRVFIRAAKGKKDRYVVFPQKLQNIYSQYIEGYRPNYWLIEGQDGGQYSPRSIQNMFHVQIERAAIDAYATVHTLRHSYATHLLDMDVDLRRIQEALGHNSIKTTEIYTHIQDTNKYRFRSPIDDMDL